MGRCGVCIGAVQGRVLWADAMVKENGRLVRLAGVHLPHGDSNIVDVELALQDVAAAMRGAERAVLGGDWNVVLSGLGEAPADARSISQRVRVPSHVLPIVTHSSACGCVISAGLPA